MKRYQLKLAFAVSTAAFSVIAIAVTPNITSMSQYSGLAGTQITISGTNLNYRGNGTTWSGSVPYKIQFPSNTGGVINATFTYVSSTKLTATVPTNGGTGKLKLVDGAFIDYSTSSWTTNAKLKIVNNSQYFMVSAMLGTTQLLNNGAYLNYAGGWYEWAVNPGTYSMYFGIGYLENGLPDIWFQDSGNVTFAGGTTVTVTYNPHTASELLSNGLASSNWVGQYWQNGTLKTAKFNVAANGTWKFYVNNVYQSTGSVVPVSWPNLSSTVKFKFGNSNTAECYAPFASFYLRNGPADWPIIEYFRQ